MRLDVGEGVAIPQDLDHAALFTALLFALHPVQTEAVTYISGRSIWEDTVERSPINARAHNNLGFAYANIGRPLEALEEYQQALKLRPGYTTAKENLDALRFSLCEK